MNVLTQIKNQQKVTQGELSRGVKETASWHDQFKNSAYVFAGGLPYDLTEGDLLAIFSQYGEIVDVNLVRDRDTGKSRGFAYLAYEDQRSTVVAVDNLNGSKVLGRVLKVDHVGDYRVKKEEQEAEEAAAAAAKRPAADNSGGGGGGGGGESSGGRTLQPWESGSSLFSLLTSDDAAGVDGKRKAPRAGAAAHFGDDDFAAKKARKEEKKARKLKKAAKKAKKEAKKAKKEADKAKKDATGAHGEAAAAKAAAAATTAKSGSDDSSGSGSDSDSDGGDKVNAAVGAGGSGGVPEGRRDASGPSGGDRRAEPERGRGGGYGGSGGYGGDRRDYDRGRDSRSGGGGGGYRGSEEERRRGREHDRRDDYRSRDRHYGNEDRRR